MFSIQVKGQEKETLPKQEVFAAPYIVDEDLVQQLMDARKYGNKQIEQQILSMLFKYEMDTGQKELPSFVDTKISENKSRWGNDVPVRYTTANEKSPTILSLSGESNTPKIYVASEEWSGTSAVDKIIVARSTDHGATFNNTTPHTINLDKPLSLPKITQVSDSYLGVVYVYHFSSTDKDVYFTKVNSTLTSGSLTMVDNSGYDIERPSITSDYQEFPDDAYLYVIYYEILGANANLKFRLSTDDGSFFSAPVTIASNFTIPYNFSTSIAYKDGRLIVAYTARGSGSDDIKTAYSTNTGGSWSTPITVASTTKDELYPQVSLSTGNYGFIFYEYHYTTTDRDIYYAYTTNGGSSWNTNNPLVSSGQDERYPDVKDFSPGSNSSVFTSFSNLSTNQVVIYKTNYTSPTNWTYYSSPNSGEFNVSSDDISAILPKYTPTGGVGVGIAWVQLVGSDHDIYFDADWLNSTPPPPVPTLVSPADGSTTSDQTPSFDWTNSTGATGYDIQVDNSSSFTSPEINASPTSSNYTPSSNLAYGTYYWRVRAKNANGTSNWTSVWSFTIIDNSPPPVPTLVSPADGSTTSDQTPSFDWTNSTGATGYDIQVDNNSSFTSPEINASPTSSNYTPGSNLAYGTYYWRVRAKNANGTSNWTSVWLFTIQNQGTAVPFNPVPPTEGTPGSIITVDMDLGNASNQVSNLTVISFDLHFTNTAIIDYVPNSAVIGDFWSNVTPSSPTIIVDEPSGKVSVSVFAIGSGGQSGYGTVISLDFNISSSASDGQVIDWSIPVYQANNASGGTIQLSVGNATTTITEGVCVWPGDTNNDGQVTIIDINPIIINFGDTGPSRPGASLSWICQMCEPWTPESDTYVDCNGNGQVDIIDINAVIVNYGKTHSKSNESSKSQNSSNGNIVSSNSATAPLTGTSPSYMSPGTDYWVEISLGDASNPVNDMNVVSFELLYDNTDKIDYIEYEVGSFLNGATPTVIPDDANGKISASAFNLSQAYNGHGMIFRFKFNVKASNPSGPIVQINNTWGAVQANRTDGSEQPINPIPFTYDILPVELTSFTANIVENQVSLRWETASETNNKGFDLFRNDELVTFIPGYGTTTETKSYIYDDRNLQNGNYVYRLIQLDYDGTRNEVASIEVEVDYVPKEYSLSQNYPNPFNPSTTIEFGLPKASNVEIVIYNLTGEKIKEVVNESFVEGIYKVNVDLSDYPSGLYLYRMKTNDYSDTKKMMLIK